MKKAWCDSLPTDIHNRLCACKTRRSDIAILVNVK